MECLTGKRTSSSSTNTVCVAFSPLQTSKFFVHMLTAMDVFDSMLEKIQQFPLDANSFERHLKRLDKSHNRYRTVYERLVSRLVSPENERYVKIATKIKRCLHRKMKVTKKFEGRVSKLLGSLKEMAKMANIDLSIVQLHGNGTSVVRINGTSSGSRKYCSCGGRASGTMVCCDNPKCEVKWFHAKCMSLTPMPKEGWKCPKCSAL